MEGILMKGPERTSIVTRGVDGVLETKIEENNGISQKYEIFQLPFFRGIGALWDSMGRGMKALEYATNKLEESEERKAKQDLDRSVQPVGVSTTQSESETQPAESETISVEIETAQTQSTLQPNESADSPAEMLGSFTKTQAVAQVERQDQQLEDTQHAEKEPAPNLESTSSAAKKTEEKLGFFARKLGKERAEKLEMALITAVAVVLALGLFFFVPTWVANFFRPAISNNVVLNLIEGVIRIVFFLVYVIAISKLEELKRVFMYHGAEHKTIACYEHGEALTVENVRKYPRVHPRCGTSFLANMVILSALVLSVFGWPHPVVRLITRILLIPVLVGITYELNVWTGRHDNVISRMLRVPGKFIQQVATVKEPTDDMIEVAIVALEAVIPEDPEADVWK